MLFGSLSGSPLDVASGLTGLGGASVGLFGGGPRVLDFASVTGAGSCLSGVDEHPTSRPTTANIAIHRFIIFRSCLSTSPVGSNVLSSSDYLMSGTQAGSRT